MCFYPPLKDARLTFAEKMENTAFVQKKFTFLCYDKQRKTQGALGEAPGVKCGACHTPNLWAEAETLF